MSENIKYISFFNKETSISLQIPETWTLEQINENQFRLFGTYHEEFDYSSTISFMKIKTKDYNIELMRKQMNDSLKEMVSKYNEFLLVSQNENTIDEMPISKKEFEWQDIDTGLHFSQTQTFVLYSPDICFLINSATLFQLKTIYNPVFEKIINSMRIII